MENIFDINTIIFTVIGYPMSYLEFFGTIFNLWCVWLTAKGKISSWPIGLVGVVLYLFLFYQIQLYSDFFEQIYFFFTGFYGWYLWLNLKSKNKPGEEKQLKVSQARAKEKIIYILVIILGTIFLGSFMKNIHLYLPTYFFEPAALPFLDAFTTILSFAATILMAKKRFECWYLWILVDIIGIGLYYAKDVKFISLEYLIFLVLATKGLIQWQRELKTYETDNYKNAGTGVGEVRAAA